MPLIIEWSQYTTGERFKILLIQGPRLILKSILIILQWHIYITPGLWDQSWSYRTMEYIQAAEDPTPIYSVLTSPQFVFIFIFSNSQNKILVGLKRPGHPQITKKLTYDVFFPCSRFAFFFCFSAFSSVISANVLYTHMITIIIVFIRSGVEKTREMNIPLESKYWNIENNLQFIAAISLMYSAQYTNTIMKRKWAICSL